MPVQIVHLSDLHLRAGWEEAQGFVLDGFFSDLEKQLSSPDECYLIFSGDIAQSGGDENIFQYFNDNMGQELAKIGLNKKNIILVPGNHDLDRRVVEKDFALLKGLQERRVTQDVFNDQIYRSCPSLLQKFQKFLAWQNQISDFCMDESSFGGKGFSLSDQIGVYCLNTALYSFGGASDESGDAVEDDGFLPVETRAMYKWVQETDFEYRILVMHHPVSWLTDWSKKSVQKLYRKSFDLLLFGHIHKGEALCCSDGRSSIVECAAPPLFAGDSETFDSETLGYSVIDINAEEKSTKIRYRQWVADDFLNGVNLSKTDDGTVHFSAGALQDHDAVSLTKTSPEVHADIKDYLQDQFDKSLQYYTSLPSIWVMPNLADQAENSIQNGQAVLQTAEQFAGSLSDCFIKSPAQFGLTSLGRYLALTAWEKNPGKFVLFIEGNQVKNYDAAIRKTIDEKLAERGLSEEALSAIILDEPAALDERKLNNIKKLYPEIPLVVLARIDDHELVARSFDFDLDQKYTELYLWALDRNQVRKVVSKFIDTGRDLDEDDATQKLVDDLESLNLHRSQLNCLTLLSVYQHQIDFSPINRTEMLEKFLHVIFSNYKRRKDYSNQPDMKDSLYVLGAFCENLFRRKDYIFSKREFLTFAIDFCEKVAVDIDIARLFDILIVEKIFLEKTAGYGFRFLSWFNFFCAHRMHHNEKFREHIISDIGYVNFPEIIEFYSGIDRRRSELIDTLTCDLDRLNCEFEARTNIDKEFDPFAGIKWSPSDADVINMRSLVDEEVAQSSLPKQVRDGRADQRYDRSRPYFQQVQNFVRESSLQECVQVMRASARTLRNSDYVSKEKKQKLLREVMRTWSKVTQILAILSPVLCKDGFVNFERLGFYLDCEFDSYDENELWRKVMMAIPSNVINYYEKDMASARMRPLLDAFLEASDSEIESHIIACNLIRQRPGGWEATVKKYMMKLDRNSYYLLQIFNELRTQYRYGFWGASHKKELENLMGIAFAKHEYRSKKPNVKLIKRTAEAIAAQIKKRSTRPSK